MLYHQNEIEKNKYLKCMNIVYLFILFKCVIKLPDFLLLIFKKAVKYKCSIDLIRICYIYAIFEPNPLASV